MIFIFKLTRLSFCIILSSILSSNFYTLITIAQVDTQNIHTPSTLEGSLVPSPS